MTTGKDGSQRIVVESGTYVAKYRDGSGLVHTVSTGCRDEGAARSVLGELERRAELVKSGVMTAGEDRIAEHQSTSLAEHFEGYRVHLQARGRTTRHICKTVNYLKRLAIECGWSRLNDLQRECFDRWLAARRQEDMSARTLNSHRVALVAFCNWAISVERIASNPFSSIPRADEKSDRRLTRRAMTVA